MIFMTIMIIAVVFMVMLILDAVIIIITRTSFVIKCHMIIVVIAIVTIPKVGN